MKAVRIHAFGGPDKVKLEELDEPRLKSKQALVRVIAAGVNPVDWAVREKIYNPKGADRVPMTLGQDFAGVIEDIAPGARSAFKKGDAVLGEVWGSFAEYVSVPLDALVRKPKGMDFVTAASLPMPGLTAWQVTIDTARAAKGKRFLVHGAGGAVGALVAQLAKWKGAWVAATASAASFDFLRRVGVDQVIDYKRRRFENAVDEIDVVIEHLGGDTQERSLGVMRKGGMLINLIGEIDRDAARRAGVKAVDFGMTYDTRDLKKVVDLVARKMLRPHVTQVLSLEDARRALDLNQRGRSHGKIVLRVA
jgi:NADPH:quinone reductase-like Zn-dependent oxidoreductase